ncbi:hypothetical protein H0H87_011325 [Tephrocybe sp. NHM501043]|nr:hypothetical protein H0H87_011325 [Tephrocybe sp. NHM501043]
MKAVPDNFYSTLGLFNFNYYFPAQETNFEDEEVEVVVEEWYDSDILANLKEDNDFEDHNDTTLHAIPLGNLKFDLLQVPETSSISTVSTLSHIWGNTLPDQPSITLTSGFDFTSLSLNSHTESQDIHQYACATPPPPCPQHIHSTATQHADNLVKADLFNITPLTSQYLVPSPYSANDSSQSTFGHMHAPLQWAPHSQAAPQPMYPPSTSQQSQMPSQQPILQAPHPQATCRTLAPMPPGFVELASNPAINIISKRLDATGIMTMLVLILCAIEYALDCLIAGIKLHFWQEVYESIYQKYIGFMREYTQNKGSYLYHQFILTCSQLSDLAKSQPTTLALVDSDSLLWSTLVPNPITPPGWTPPDNSLYNDDSHNE